MKNAYGYHNLAMSNNLVQVKHVAVRRRQKNQFGTAEKRLIYASAGLFPPLITPKTVPLALPWTIN